jgi:hypothetical protein
MAVTDDNSLSLCTSHFGHKPGSAADGERYRNDGLGKTKWRSLQSEAPEIQAAREPLESRGRLFWKIVERASSQEQRAPASLALVATVKLFGAPEETTSPPWLALAYQK